MTARRLTAPGRSLAARRRHSVRVQRHDSRLAPSVLAAGGVSTGPGRLGCLGCGRTGGGQAGFHAGVTARKKKPRLAAGSGPSWFVVGPVVRLHCRYSVSLLRVLPVDVTPLAVAMPTFSFPSPCSAREGGRFIRGAASAFRGAASIDPVGPVPSIPNLWRKETTCVPSHASFFIINSL